MKPLFRTILTTGAFVVVAVFIGFAYTSYIWVYGIYFSLFGAESVFTLDLPFQAQTFGILTASYVLVVDVLLLKRSFKSKKMLREITIASIALVLLAAWDMYDWMGNGWVSIERIKYALLGYFIFLATFILVTPFIQYRALNAGKNSKSILWLISLQFLLPLAYWALRKA